MKKAPERIECFFANSFKLKGVLYRNGAIPVCIKALSLIQLYYTITLCIKCEQRMKNFQTIG